MRQDTLVKLAWLYAIGFIGICVITHTPALTDASGLSFGLFKIDPVDDIVHLLSGVAGVIVAWPAHSDIPLFFRIVGIAYMGDAIVGMTMSRGLLDGSLFIEGPGGPDFGMTNWALNLPHVIISGIALVIGFMKPPALRHQQPPDPRGDADVSSGSPNASFRPPSCWLSSRR